MILTGNEIWKAVTEGEIHISPLTSKCLNPASYDLHLGGTCIVHECAKVLDTKTANDYQKFPFDSMILVPGTLYLMHTEEIIHTRKHVTVIDGKSSLGRLGISVHQTAGYGDPGYNGQYTLEVTVIHPVRVYAGMRFAQARFHTLQGELTDYQENGHYASRQGPVMGPIASRSFRQFES